MDDDITPHLHIGGGGGGIRRQPLGRATFVASDSDSSFTEEDDRASVEPHVELSGNASSSRRLNSVSFSSSARQRQPSSTSQGRISSMIGLRRVSATHGVGVLHPVASDPFVSTVQALGEDAHNDDVAQSPPISGHDTVKVEASQSGSVKPRAVRLCSTEEVHPMSALRNGHSASTGSMVLGGSTVAPRDGSLMREENTRSATAVDRVAAAHPSSSSVEPLTSFEEVQRSANAVQRPPEPQEEAIVFRHGAPTFSGDVVVPCFEAGDGVLYLLADRATGRRGYYNDSRDDAMEVRFVLSAKSRISPLGKVRLTLDEARGRFSGEVVVPPHSTEMVWVGHVEGEQMKYCLHHPTTSHIRHTLNSTESLH